MTVLWIMLLYLVAVSHSQMPPEENCRSGECVPYFACKLQGVTRNGRRILGTLPEERVCRTELDVCCSDILEEEPPGRKLSPYDGCGWRNKDGLYFEIPNFPITHAKFAEFPWMVAVLVVEEDDEKIRTLYKCGGSLITQNIVLTAAHCIDDVPLDKLTVRAGEWNARSFSEPIFSQELPVVTKIVHEDYEQLSLRNDIAILILNDTFTFNDNVQPICLPPTGANFDSSTCYATGWGRTQFGRVDTYQVVLKKIDLPVIPRDRCQSLFRRTRLGNFFELHPSFICAGGEKGKDACVGDGGSPLVCPIPGTTDRFYQAGIVSWGIDCGDQDVPGAYASIPHLRSWIDQKLSNKITSNSVFTP